MKLFLLIFILTFFASNSLNHSPIIYGIYNSEGDFGNMKNYSSLGGWGILVKYNNDNLSIKIRFL